MSLGGVSIPTLLLSKMSAQIQSIFFAQPAIEIFSEPFSERNVYTASTTDAELKDLRIEHPSQKRSILRSLFLPFFFSISLPCCAFHQT
jgi:hypothetical protein